MKTPRWPLLALCPALCLAACVPTGRVSSNGSDDPDAAGDVLVIDLQTDARAPDARMSDETPDGGAPDGAPPEPEPPAPPEPEPEPPNPPEPEPEPEAPAPEPVPDPEPPEPEPPADPCVEIMCVANATCADGDCVCLPGFVLDGEACVAPPRSPLELRTEAEVCARWQADRVTVPEAWRAVQGGGECDPGDIAAAARQNALRRTNLYRWLAGADPVVLDPALVEQQQACAAIQAAAGRLNHQPGPNAPCYTDAGARGAGSSNLAGGGRLGVAESVDLYISDRGVGSLGHRRWVINPAAQTTAFGWKAQFSCMYSFSGGRRHAVEIMAWPPPGPVPVDIPRGDFSVQLYGVNPGADFTIAVGIDGAPPAPVAANRLQEGFGGRGATYAFSPGEVFVAGRAVEVVLDGLADGEPRRWTTRFVSCR